MKQSIEEITKRLEQGVKEVFTSERYAEYLTAMGKFPDYSFNNICLIMMQKPDASLVAGYKAWQTKFNRQVRKGEKGIKILAPMQRKYKKMVEADGKTEEQEVSYMSYFATTVFDISQTDGEELPKIVIPLKGSVEDYDSLITKLISIAPVPVIIRSIDGTALGYYDDIIKQIVIKEGMAQQQTLETLIHEIAHSLLHGKDGIKADRNTREVQAESIAYVVAQQLGLDTSDYSFGYIAEWSAGKELKELSASMDVIHKTSMQIIENIQAA